MKSFLTTLKGKIIAGVATAGVVGAVVAAVLILNSGYRTIVVDGLNGLIQVANNSKITEAFIGQHLADGDDVSVPEESDLTLALDQDKYIYAEEKTHFWVEAKGKEGDTRTVIHQDKGSNLYRIDNKLKDSEYYKVDTPNSTMSVRGTVFRVTCLVDENGDTYTIIEVFEGEVDVDAKMENGDLTTENRALKAGDRAIIRSNPSISEFVDSAPDYPENGGSIDYALLPQKTALTLGKVMDDGRVLCITKELLFDIVEITAHEFVDSGEKVEATCTEEGYILKICSICNEETEKEIIPKVDHDYITEETEGSSCDKPGKKVTKCKICGEIKEEITLEAKDHKFGEWVIVKAPTTTEYGERVATCTICGTEKRERIGKLVEIPVLPTVNPAAADIPAATDVTDPATSQVDTPASTATTDSSISDSDDSNSDDSDDEDDDSDDKCSDGHDYKVKTTESTCTKKGKKVKTCKRCGKKVTTELDLKDHEYGDVTPASGTTHKQTCKNCGKEKVSDCSVSSWTSTATVTETNKHKGNCDKCGNEIEESCSYSWDHDTTDCWKVCSECNHTTNMANHQGSSGNQCERGCGYTIP